MNARGLAATIAGLAAAGTFHRWRNTARQGRGPAWTTRSEVYPFRRGTIIRRGKRRKLPPVLPPPKTKNEKQDREIKQLKDKLNLDTGTHIHRTRATSSLTQGVNVSPLNDLGISTGLTLEGALSNLKYYDPSTPATLVTAPIASGTFSKTFDVKFHSKNIIRNNYTVPVKVKAWIVMPRSDTSITPGNCYTDGLADVGNPSATSPLTYLTDSPVFNKLWKIVKSKKAYLKAGEEMKISYTIPHIKYDPSYADSHTSTYKQSEGACRLLIRLHGVVAHDTVNEGIAECGVDVLQDKTFIVKYQAGADIHQITQVDLDTTGPNAIVGTNAYTGSTPEAINIQYSSV